MRITFILGAILGHAGGTVLGASAGIGTAFGRWDLPVLCSGAAMLVVGLALLTIAYFKSNDKLRESYGLDTQQEAYQRGLLQDFFTNSLALAGKAQPSTSAQIKADYNCPAWKPKE